MLFLCSVDLHLLWNIGWAPLVAQMVKNPPATQESTCNAGDTGLIPGSGRSPGGGHGNLLQYSCLENPTDRGTWRAIVHRVTKSQTWLKRLNHHVYIYLQMYTKKKSWNNRYEPEISLFWVRIGVTKLVLHFPPIRHIYIHLLFVLLLKHKK